MPLERLYRWERERAARPFLTQPLGHGAVRDWTWAQAADEVRRIAAYLEAQNWAPGTRVAIVSKNCAWWIMADLAIWMAGHVSVPVYYSLKAPSVRQILELSGARACFLGATEESDVLDGIPAGVLRIMFPTRPAVDSPSWDALVAATGPLTASPTPPPQDLATIIYTSGTTGIPKGVMHSFAAMAFNSISVVELLGMTAEQRILSYLPLAHIVERIGVEALTLYLGSRIFFTEGVETFITDLHRARPTIFLSVPRLLLKFQQNVFAKAPREKLDRLFRIPIVGALVKRKILGALGLRTVRFAASGAAPLPTEILLWYRRLGLPLVEGYGMTECLITHLPTADNLRPGYVGPPVPGVEAKLGENSELLLKSPMHMLGYFNDPEGSQKSFLPDGFFRTGDVAEIAPDGQLKIVGRLKEQFKTSKGKYVAPAPIESKLVAHCGVEACCLMGAGQPSPFAVAVIPEEMRQKCADPQARAALEQSFAAQLEAVNAELDPHERIAFIAIAEGPWSVSNGLLTPTLKLKRSVLEARYQNLIDDWNARKRPVVWESQP
ncbi:MAG TPA: AMP-binding protein [Terracidiphilus sp.]|nr:AMP-binding protein [Terracidiphilus sp.]